MAENARLFMKLSKRASGTLIQGESAVPEFVNQIELEQWSWDMSRERDDKPASGSASKGTGAREDIAAMPFKLSKYMDRSTPSILSAMVADELLKAEIVLEEASDAEFRLVIKLDKVRVREYGFDADVEEHSGQVKEEWTFSYESLQFDYTAAGTSGFSTVRIERAPEASRTARPPTPKAATSSQAQAFFSFIAWREQQGLPGATSWREPADSTPDWKGAAPMRPQ